MKFSKNLQSVVIGCGQAGAKIGSAMISKFGGKCIDYYINTSAQDLLSHNIDKSRIFGFATDSLVGGSGKDPEKVKIQLKNSVTSKNELEKFIGKIILKEIICSYYNQNVFILYSAAGGSGSSLGPYISMILAKETFIDTILNIIKNDSEFSNIELDKDGIIERLSTMKVFGICALPSLTEGTISMRNTIKCLSSIKKLVDNKLGRFFLIDNDQAVDMSKNDRYGNINTDVGTYINRYFNLFGISNYSNADMNDRYGALSLQGIHSLIKVSKDEDGNIISDSPFYVPEGMRVIQTVGELEESLHSNHNSVDENGEKIDSYDYIITSNGLEVDDKITGYYDKSRKLRHMDELIKKSINEISNEDIKGEENPEFSIIHFAGFTNLSKISEKYEKRHNQLRSMNTKYEKRDKADVKSLDGSAIKTIQEFEKYEYNTNHLSKQDLNDFEDDFLS